MGGLDCSGDSRVAERGGGGGGCDAADVKAQRQQGWLGGAKR